jgi:hypothetical protein
LDVLRWHWRRGTESFMSSTFFLRLNLLQSEQEEESETESEFEAASAQSSSKTSSSEAGSDFDGSNASDDEGSGSDFDDESEGKVHPIVAALTMSLTGKRSGEDWDELERKAAKCKAHLIAIGHELISTTADKKRAEGGHKGDESDDSDRPKKKAPAKSKPHAKASANGKGKR